MIKTIRAAVLEELGKALVIKEVELPELLPGQALVKILFSGMCRSQLMEVRGGRGDDPWLPHLLGHEGSGIVVAVGDGVAKVKPGDEVILGWVKGAGLDAPGAKYKCGAQIINSGRVTTFSNYSIVSESRVVKKPVGLPFETAILFGCALPTGAGMVLNELKPSSDSSVIVLGLGGIGLSALLALKALGVRMIIAIDVSGEKLELAQQLGAAHVFNSASRGFRQAVLDLTNGGADMCVESGGQVSTIELGFSLIRKGGGRLLFASHPPEGEMIHLAPHELISGKQISGSWGGATSPDRDIPKMFEIFRDANTPLPSLLTKRYSLEHINDALDDLGAGRVFRPLIVMEHHDETVSLGR
ncbi:MAG: zinc-binding dehydrogenase [Gammaproteobacteria bacterium]|nr:zinc-binding dehydrogenase [Gammaproteobacteria bacterium]